MPGIVGIFGFNPPNATNDTLLAVYGNDIVNVSTGVGAGQNLLSGNNSEFEAFLGKVWEVNGGDGVRNSSDGATWTKTGPTCKAPTAKYIRKFHTRLYLANIAINGVSYPSRVWYSDLPKNGSLTWGYETQSNLQQSAGSNVVISPGALFVTQNIKVGDALTITSGPNVGEYAVSAVISETILNLTTTLTYSSAASSYWVGGNWLDVVTDDNDILTGFGDSSDQLLLFKRNCLHRYDGKTLVKVKGVPGTTSNRSVVNIQQFTFYFHSSGVWRYDGVTSTLISRQIKDYFDQITSTNFNQVVGWLSGIDIYRCFVGTITSPNDASISISNCYFDMDIATQGWAIGSFPVSITCATTFIESQQVNTYLGTSTGVVYQDNIGNQDATLDIPFSAETGWYFPWGGVAAGMITRVQVITNSGRNISVKYKRFGTPLTIDKDWLPLGSIEDYISQFNPDSFNENPVRGLKFLFLESSSATPLEIDKIIIFGQPITVRPTQQE